MIARHPDWRLHLDALISERMHQPFAWGRNDCALFAADCVQAITGVDLAANLRSHRTARQALRTIRRHGDLCDLATQALGAPVGVHQAQEGDVLMVTMGKRMALGVLLEDDMLVGPGADGLCMAPRRDALCAWRVG